MESATILQTPILLSEKKWLKDFKEQHGLDTYGEAIAKIIETYKRTLWTPAQIEAANDPEDSGAEHIIALALEVIRDEIPDADSYTRTGIRTGDGGHE